MTSDTGSAEQQQNEGQDPGRWRILAVLLVAIFMSLVSVSSVNVALPSIQSGLGATQSQLQWVLSGYALTFGVVLVAAGRAGDIIGRAPLFIGGVALFTLSSVAAGLATDPTMLVVARFIQGIGSGLLNPQGVGMIQQYFRGAERGRAFGAFGSAVGVSVGVGPLLGGLLIQLGGVHEGWRWIFFINLPVGILAIVLALLWFPRPMVVRRSGRTVGGVVRALDPVGALLLGVAIFAVLLPFMEARAQVSGWLWALVPVGVVLGGAWMAWERRYQRRGHSPMVDLDIFRTRSFSRGTALVGLYFLGVTSVWVLIALYFQEGLGHTPLESGSIGLPNAVASALSATWAGRHVLRLGRRLVIGGMISVLLGLGLSVLVIELHGHGLVSEWWLLLTLTFVGLGQGAVVSPNQTLTLAEVPLEYAGSAGGIMQTGQRVGTSVGIAVITAAAFTVLGTGGWANAISVGFGLVAVVLLGALAVGFADERSRRQEPTPAS
ncbi:MFS transporter [Tersicoccus sp. Bi-70]|uniref:MFS transporter n=1 Tax=Tersicoccus sp. Bi-70 TaxID=1897634 RepID=UPI000976D88D|nr:MFS transporter [Tersicoccus sp. Bi-70]OMH36681.1 MFS transporter permease [Tersicoccus sp. Bi-70]